MWGTIFHIWLFASLFLISLSLLWCYWWAVNQIPRNIFKTLDVMGWVSFITICVLFPPLLPTIGLVFLNDWIKEKLTNRAK